MCYFPHTRKGFFYESTCQYTIHLYLGKNILYGRKIPNSDRATIGIDCIISEASPKNQDLKSPALTKRIGTKQRVYQAHFSPLRKPVRVMAITKNDQLILSSPIFPYIKRTKLEVSGLKVLSSLQDMSVTS